MKDFLSRLCQRMKSVDVFNKKVFSALYASAFVCIMIISVAQVGLKSTATRRFFTKIDSYEGAYFEATAEVQESVSNSVVLSVSYEDGASAKAYVNGQEYCNLVSGDNEIQIKDTSVIEIYCPDGKANVKLKSMTDGLVMYTSDEEITVEKQMKIFGRLGIK